MNKHEADCVSIKFFAEPVECALEIESFQEYKRDLCLANFSLFRLLIRIYVLLLNPDSLSNSE
jgi:hypothetical protein